MYSKRGPWWAASPHNGQVMLIVFSWEFIVVFMHYIPGTMDASLCNVNVYNARLILKINPKGLCHHSRSPRVCLSHLFEILTFLHVYLYFFTIWEISSLQCCGKASLIQSNLWTVVVNMEIKYSLLFSRFDDMISCVRYWNGPDGEVWYDGIKSALNQVNKASTQGGLIKMAKILQTTFQMDFL